VAYSKLVFTVVCQDNDKYEVYAQGEHAKPERIIHYKLREKLNSNDVNAGTEYEWVVVNPNMPLPKGQEYQIASNLLWYFEEL